MTVPNPDLVAAIAAQSGQDPSAVREMLAAQEIVAKSVPKFTVQMDPASHNTAVRTVQDGVPIWWVVDHSDGSCTRDLTPNKEWPELYTPKPNET